MSDKTDYQLDLLARAEDADGKPMYLGLSREWQEQDRGIIPYGSVNIPNPDPMAMVAAAQAQGWVITFAVSGHDVSLYKKVPSIKTHGSGLNNLAALTDVIFHATETLAVNWGECPWKHYPESGCQGSPGVDMARPKQTCHGTGKVLKEEE